MLDQYTHDAIDHVHRDLLAGAITYEEYIERASSELAPYLSCYMSRFDRVGLIADYWIERDMMRARFDMFILKNNEKLNRRRASC